MNLSLEIYPSPPHGSIYHCNHREFFLQFLLTPSQICHKQNLSKINCNKKQQLQEANPPSDQSHWDCVHKTRNRFQGYI